MTEKNRSPWRQRVAKKLLRHVPQWLEMLWFERRLRKATPVIVFQMGKVGSSSLYKSLVRQYPGVVEQLHSLAANHPKPKARRLYRWAVTDRQPVHLISLTREPIGRNISAFFENFARDTGCAYRESKFSVLDLQRLFLVNYRHDLPLRWFDTQIRGNFGIDVYANPFPASGIATYVKDNVRLLVMRSELPDHEKSAAVSEFLGLPSLELENANIGEQKDYANTYRTFRKEVVLPADYVTRMCESKYFNHFYPRETVESVRARWTR